MLDGANRGGTPWVAMLCLAALAACGTEPNGQALLDAAMPAPAGDVGAVADTALPAPDATLQLDIGLAADSARGPGDARIAADARPDAAQGNVSFRCTQVIGYSQVNQWYVQGNFESYVDDARWQLLYNGGAGVDMWQDPDYRGWSNALISPCAVGSDGPDRVLLSVSGPYGDDEDAWVEAIRATLATLRTKVPAATLERIVLQPVVGGPNHQTCLFNGQQVRASWQHAHIDNAIAVVVQGDPRVVAGMSPEVGDCSEYADAKGHFTSAGSQAAGKAIGEYYAREEGSR